MSGLDVVAYQKALAALAAAEDEAARAEGIEGELAAAITAAAITVGTGLAKNGSTVSLALTKALVLATGIGAADVGADPAGSAATQSAAAQAAAETFASNAVSAALAGLDAAESPADAVGSGITHTGIGQTVGGVVITQGMRVLDVSNSIGAGLWVAAAGAWARTPDFQVGASAQGKLVEVDNGGVWLCVAGGPVTIGTSTQLWIEIDASVLQAGAGLLKTGNTLSLALTKALVLATGVSYSDLGTVPLGQLPETVQVVAGAYAAGEIPADSRLEAATTGQVPVKNADGGWAPGTPGTSSNVNGGTP